MKRIAMVMVVFSLVLTGCASVEIDNENETTETMIRIVDTLNELVYQPYTCDGLPEYQLTAADGTVYAINFSEKWVWRGNSEQAELSDELLAQLKENLVLFTNEMAIAMNQFE